MERGSYFNRHNFDPLHTLLSVEWADYFCGEEVACPPRTHRKLCRPTWPRYEQLRVASLGSEVGYRHGKSHREGRALGSRYVIVVAIHPAGKGRDGRETTAVGDASSSRI